MMRNRQTAKTKLRLQIETENQRYRSRLSNIKSNVETQRSMKSYRGILTNLNSQQSVRNVANQILKTADKIKINEQYGFALPV